MARQPLEGLLVLDFTTLLPGPLAGLILAEAGARVIKIERPQGEDMRLFPPRWDDESAAFALLNRGKESLALDLMDEAQRALIDRLIKQADIVIEQFRPGVMERLGLGYDQVRALNPAVIYCSITGYGASGPKAQSAGHDLNYIGDTGLLSLSMGAAQEPTIPPALIADIGGGSMPAVINILLALINRQASGQGANLDIAMSDAMFMFGYWAMAQGLTGNGWPHSGAELLTGGSPRYQIYPTSDGRHVAAAPLEQRFWAVFCELIDLPEALRGVQADPQETRAAVGAIIARHSADHWRAVFANKDCCCSIVATMQEALADAHFKERGLFEHLVSSQQGKTMPAIPVPVDRQFRVPARKPRTAPQVGSANEAIAKSH